MKDVPRDARRFVMAWLVGWSAFTLLGDFVLARQSFTKDPMNPILVLWLTPFNTIMIGAWATIAKLRPRKMKASRGIRVIDRGTQVGLRPVWAAKLASGIARLAVAFGLVLAVSVVQLFVPAESAAKAASWIAVVCAGAASIYVLCGAFDRVVDRVGCTLTLPSVPGIRKRITIDLEDIVEVNVVDTIGPHGEAFLSRFVPTIRWCAEGKPTETELCGHRTRYRAEEFVCWLRAELALARSRSAPDSRNKECPVFGTINATTSPCPAPSSA